MNDDYEIMNMLLCVHDKVQKYGFNHNHTCIFLRTSQQRTPIIP